jgi:hypothetical protein
VTATVHSFADARDGRVKPKTLSTVAQSLWSLMEAGYLEAHQLMLEQADDVLFDWAERGERTRECMNLMRTLRISRDSLRQDFEKALRTAPLQSRGARDLADFDISELALQDGEAVELGIAAQNVVSRVEGRLTRNLFDVRVRLREAENRLGAEVPEVLLDPRLGVDGLVDSLGSLNADVTERLVMIKLYERQLLARFPAMILAVSAKLDELGVPRSVRPMAPPAAHEGGRASAPPMAADPNIAGAPSVAVHSEALAATAEQIARSIPGGGGWHDGDLLAAIQALLQTLHQRSGVPSAGLSVAPGAGVPALGLPSANLLGQRAAMAGELLQAYVGDPLVSHDIREALSSVSAPVLRVALADPALLSNRTHPVRAALDRLAVLGRRVGDTEARAYMAAALVADIESAAEVAAPPDAEANEALIDGDSLSAFREELRDGVRERQRWIVEAAQVRARTEIETRLRRHPGVPEVARTYLSTAVEPLVGILLMRVGDGGELWSLLMRVVDRLLVTLDANLPTDPREVDSLARSLEAMMRAAGFSNTRRDRLLSEWRQLCKGLGDGSIAAPQESVVAPVPAAPPAAGPAKAPDAVPQGTVAEKSETIAAVPQATAAADPEDPEAVVVSFFTVGAWFKVHDPDFPRARYGQVASMQDDAEGVSFVSVTGRTRFTLGWAALIAGVREGKTMPLSRDPAFFAARDRLTAAVGG